jgi:dolichyl-phosphate-mannose--protein O-mannosyl transferase
VGPILIALLSFGLRLWHLGTPKTLVFDEVYYVGGARDFLKHGVEVTGNSPEFVVHPPIGKWCIALGIKIFGNNPFGWRIAVAVAGAITIYLVGRIAQQLFHSSRLSTLASLLMALDGLHLVHSRTALLDLFLTLFVLLAVNAWLKEHFWRSGIWFGFAVGTKWSGIYFVVAFAILTLYNDRKRLQTWTRTLATRFMQFFVIPIAVYIASWTGWFISSLGWDRHWAENSSTWKIIPAPLRSLWHYHSEILKFHTTLTEHHNYQANPWSWLIMGRPTSFFYASPKTCGSKNCSQEILALGTPILWWAATLALAVVIGFWITSIAKRKSDTAAGIILLGVVAGYLPWFLFQRRTVFNFYAIVFEPFLILALVYCANQFLGEPPWTRNRKILVAILVLAVAVNFLYFLPIFNASVMTYSSWYQRMWFPSWI